MGGWMQPRRGSEAEARRPSFCAPSTHPPTPPLLQALYMVAVAKTPGIAAGVGPEERRTPIAMGLRYATQFGDGSPFKSGDAYERMCACARLSPPPPQASLPDYGCTASARTTHMHHAPRTCTTHHAPAPRTMHHAPRTTHHAPCTLHAPLCHALTLILILTLTLTLIQGCSTRRAATRHHAIHTA